MVRTVNLISTIYWNFKLFPINIAKKVPIFLGYNVDFVGVKRGNIKLNCSESEIKKGMIHLGITKYPIYPAKGIHTLLRLSDKGSISFGKDVHIMKGCSLISSYKGNIEIGNDVFINQNTIIYSCSKVQISNHVALGWSVQLYDSSFHYLIDVHKGEIKNPTKSIYIGENVWIANHASITAGAKIPKFTIVASHSLVNKSFMDYKNIGGLLLGCPAKFVENGKVRLLNEKVENIIKNNYFVDENIHSLVIDEIGYSLKPIHPDNILFHRYS